MYKHRVVTAHVLAAVKLRFMLEIVGDASCMGRMGLSTTALAHLEACVAAQCISCCCLGHLKGCRCWRGSSCSVGLHGVDCCKPHDAVLQLLLLTDAAAAAIAASKENIHWMQQQPDQVEGRRVTGEHAGCCDKSIHKACTGRAIKLVRSM